jgi:hypothetical protein
MTDARRPLHVAAFLGLSAGAYAIGLAGVTALQADSEAMVLLDRVPTERSIAEIVAQHDALETGADRAARSYADAVRGYDTLSGTLAEVEAQLATVADIVGSVQGATAALPTRVVLPRVTRTVTAASQPTVHATTAASGG